MHFSENAVACAKKSDFHKVDAQGMPITEIKGDKEMGATLSYW